MQQQMTCVSWVLSIMAYSFAKLMVPRSLDIHFLITVAFHSTARKYSPAS